jgi:hypothetical protein
MNDHDPLDALRAARRVSDAEIAGSVDRQALRALREGITMIDRDQPATLEAPRRGRRLGRRGVSAGALALVLVGGGAAFAAYQQWYVGGGGADGLTCMTTWQDPSDSDEPLDSTGGPALTGDPVADCQRYQQLSGRPEINDPVAFTRNGYVYVAPRDQVPSDGTPLTAATADTAAAMRLDAALQDWVDGGNSRCFTSTTAVPYMKAEIARLGLAGWSTKVMPDNRPYQEGPCGSFYTDPVSRTAMFLPDRGPDPNVRRPDPGISGFVYDVRDALRTGITTHCVSTKQAQDVVAKALGAEHHWPTTVVRTNSPCASVDLVVGGSVQVWIYGPEVARP